MQPFIKELWYGNINPQEARLFNTPQYKELIDYTARHRKALEETLSAEQKELFEKMMDNQNEFESLAEAEIFAYGFRLGAKIMLEILQ